ncbi:MAG: rod shape-determining protein RodA [Victivallaceae bacterium]|nr:rod shape-determining protein RodA [Victivallaceae bacterium]MDD4316930.1 rod shape-determining protein RodA [Victivallaceae bacterium]NLK82534.1 rod shape-determining protein RodA [Lentisphaerota bacterium]
MKFRTVKTSPGHNGFGFLADFCRKWDMLQISVMLILLGIGFVFIYSTGMNIGEEAARRFLFRQICWSALGISLWLLLSHLDYRSLRSVSWIFYTLCIVLLVLVLEVGTSVYGATRWLSLPGGMRLQPSEFTKLGLIMMLSSVMSTMNFQVNRLSSWLLIGVLMITPFLLIVKEPDLGSAMILLPLTLCLVFLGGLKWRYLIIGATILTTVITVEFINEYKGYYPLLKPYQWQRIMVFLDPERDLQHRGYNQFQARLAVGSGGITGKGLGQGTQNTLGFLPQSVSNNDFIFSVIAEETGFVGCFAVLSLYSLLLYSIIRSAFLVTDDFGRYLGGAIAVLMFVHIFVNIGMSIGVIPVTGLSLPLVSYGGSFIVLVMSCLGIMQSIYRSAKH